MKGFGIKGLGFRASLGLKGARLDDRLLCSDASVHGVFLVPRTEGPLKVAL